MSIKSLSSHPSSRDSTVGCGFRESFSHAFLVVKHSMDPPSRLDLLYFRTALPDEKRRSEGELVGDIDRNPHAVRARVGNLNEPTSRHQRRAWSVEWKTLLMYALTSADADAVVAPVLGVVIAGAAGMNRFLAASMKASAVSRVVGGKGTPLCPPGGVGPNAPIRAANSSRTASFRGP